MLVGLGRDGMRRGHPMDMLTEPELQHRFRQAITALQTTGPINVGALARSIRDLHACKVAVVRRFAHGEGPDHWRDHSDMLRRLNSDGGARVA
jgi:hypothetical protein